MNAPLPNAAEPILPIGDPAVAPRGREAPFVADGRHGPDLLETGAAIQPIVELIAHGQAQTPMMIAIVGPSGAGKSFTLDRIVAGVEALAAASRTGDGPFAAQIVTVAVDSAAIAKDPASAAAAATYTALGRDNGAGANYAALADEAAHAGADPHLAANKAIERHDETRRRLEVERQSRDEIEARRARLSDVVLFETPGSRVDAYARASRGRIEARLRRFDLVSGDPTANFKDLVRDLAGAGAGSRAGVVLRSIWAYRSQARLLTMAIVFFVLAIGADQLRGATVVDWLRSLGAPLASLADWIAGHGGWIGNAIAAFVILGAIALVLNLWRAFIFTGSLFRGVRLLNFDVRERGRDLEAASARVNRRVSALTAEAETAARHAEAAEKRAKSRGPSASARGPDPLFFDTAPAPEAAARAFFSSLDKLIAGTPETGAPAVSLTPAAPVAAPKRVVLAFDNLDALSPAQALQVIETVHSLLGRAFVALFAFDPASLAPATGDGRLRERLEKLFQLFFNADRAGALGSERLIARLLGGAGAAHAPERPVDARQSLFDEPIDPAEASLLTALAPLAAATPRGVKRYLNVYRLARAAADNKAALALMLAVEQSGDAEAQAAVAQLLNGSADSALADPPGPPALLAAVRAARAANRGSIRTGDAKQARDIAGRFQLFV